MSARAERARSAARVALPWRSVSEWPAFYWRAVWWAALAAAPGWERSYRRAACERHHAAATARVLALVEREAAE